MKMKLLRKIAPLAVAGVLLGASFAAAQDLANWRANFPGADTAVVFHRSADAMAVADIVAALGTSAGGQAPTGEAHLIGAAGNDLNYGEDLFDVEDTLEKRDLPLILADGRFKETRGNTDNDVDYEQYLEFVDATGTITFEKNTETTEKPVNTYLKFDDLATTKAFRYRLVFENPVEFDTTSVDDDFELTKLKMLGREYFIVDATQNGGKIDSLTLMGGALKASQWEYSTASYTLGGKTYEVKVKIISDDDSTAVLVVNGEETDELAEGDTYVLEDDTRIGILDVIPNEGAEMTSEEAVGNDLVTFYLGAEKIEFAHGQEVEINGEAVEGSEADLQTAAAAGKLAEINLWIVPNDDIFLAKGEEWTDPILGRFKFTYQGLLSDTETIEVSTSGDDGTVTLKNIAEDELEIPVVLDDSTQKTYPGDELWPSGVTSVQDGKANSRGNLLIADGDSCTGNTTVTECEGTYLLVVGTGGEARIIEITDIDVANTEVSLREVSPDSSNNWPDRNYNTEIVLGFATIDLDVDATNTTITATSINTCGTACNAGDFLTSLGGEVGVEFNGTHTRVYLFTDDGTDLTGGDFDGGSEPEPDPIFQFIDDGTGDMIIDPETANDLVWDTEEKDSDYKVAIDRYDVSKPSTIKWGALFRYNADEDNEMTIIYPEEEAVHKVYVSELTATIPELTPGYAAGAAIGVYDTDVANVADMNHISVGGSAINSYSAELLGLSYPTYGTDPAWVSATGVDTLGKAIIKVMANPNAEGKYAMLIAGYEEVDTARAAKALRENTPILSGKSVLLDTTTETVTIAA
ncbi:MAG: hypothetical protein K6T16_00355 [Candidatus Pacearchaeota archaeon]|nr:hypothetical protein [Candidatus Pacearchaeota archaeon]